MKQLHILVYIKQVPDTEGPPDAFKVNQEAKRVVPVGIPPVINPFDESALEGAMRIKDRHGAKVTVISMGEKLAQPVLRKALAAGSDDLILLEDPLFKDLDSNSTAYVLSSIIRKVEPYDIILTGRQAGDWDFGVTGLLMAEMLQIPCINLARKVEIRDNGRVRVEKLSHNRYEVVEASTPVLITAGSELGELRYTSIRALKAVGMKPVKIYKAKDLGLDLRKLEVRQIVKLFTPYNRRQCRFVDGESLQEKGENLAVRLKKEGVI